jgi:hypothetical protein
MATIRFACPCLAGTALAETLASPSPAREQMLLKTLTKWHDPKGHALMQSYVRSWTGPVAPKHHLSAGRLRRRMLLTV